MTQPTGTPNELSVTELARALEAGALTSEAAVGACLDRIAARDGVVKAWVHLDPESALETARRRDREPRRGPFHGIPVAIKDIFDTADMPAEYGSPIYKGHRPAADAACVAQLKRAGAVILGKTHTTEFATFQPAPTCNPHNPGHTPGGSSSGSAAAVADFMAPAALGTQTFGSVIRPAAFCGVVGFKPTFGAISRAGAKQQAETLDTVGVMTRAAADLPLAMGALTGSPAADFEAAPSSPAPRIAVIRGPGWDAAQPEAVRALDDAAAALARAGAALSEARVPPVFDQALEAHLTLANYEVARAMAHERRTRPELISDGLTEMIVEGEAVGFAERAQAARARDEAYAAAHDLLAGCDALLTASAPGEAPAGLAWTGDPIFNRFWTFLQMPCLTLPFGAGPNGLPTGVQLVGARHDDARLIALAGWAEAALAREG